MRDDLTGPIDPRLNAVLRDPAPGEPAVSVHDTDLAWQRLAGRTVHAVDASGSGRQTVGSVDARAQGLARSTASFTDRASRGGLPGWLGTAAARRWVPGAIALMGLVVVAYQTGMRRAGAPSMASAPAVTTYATPVGRRAVVTLRDGSRVTLAPGTTLRVAADFGTTMRTVALSGEAFFDVAAGPHAPFLVRTGAVTTRVLGTAFDVRRYPEDGATRVAVVAGKVVVGTHVRPAAVILAAGAAASVTDSSNTAATDARASTAWTRGVLVFNDAPVPDVLAALTRWYGYHFRMTDSALVRKNLTVWISTESSQAALSTLKLALDVDLAFDGDAVIMSPRRSAGAGGATPRDARELFSPRTREIGR